ncbi:3D domain-containing protein [Marinobacterium sp. AK62]|uniref:3D domain-containing protein n=1 Tax=Marinobacterium alkalitolerans TaxID=1542925 RepID=A0ABS3Z6D2_9GAMM|nr:3D domain-containing protein [Marinobacterium alkalitolerans]MBP0047245.1 3D domain-containing protein [Marinobacterium alkalitolerans]
MSSSFCKCLILSIPLSLLGCTESAVGEKQMTVKASAYNSVVAQTNDNPTLAAWGDRLKPGMKAVAVSRDLIRQGLTHNTLIEIEGLPGKYRVLDKMNKRWTRKIDIYMGKDVEAAREWGVREVKIRWTPQPTEG